MRGTKIWIAALLALIATIGAVHAATSVAVTVTFVIPSDVALTLSYGTVTGTCSASAFMFVEHDGDINGVMNKINVSQTTSDNEDQCQDAGTAAMTVNNDGSSIINVTAEFGTNDPDSYNIEVSAAQAYADYETSCTATNLPDSGKCVNVTVATPVRITGDLAVSGTDDIWWWADFESADVGSGVGAAGSATAGLEVNATAAS